VPAAQPDRSPIALQAMTDVEPRVVHWFVDTAYLGRAASGRPFWWQARPGTHLLRAVDEAGRSDTRRIRVELSVR
jgi:penicillin-binding protein 1C